MNTKWRRFIIAAAAFAGVALTLTLGQWQLSRAAQKRDLQARMEAQSAQPTLTNAPLLASTAMQTLLLQPAQLRGRWLADKTVYLDNRPMDGRVGFFVLTPLLLEGSQQAIVVQRGWIPRDFTQRNALQPIDTPSTVVTLEGRIAPPPSKLYELGQAEHSAIRQNLDLLQFQSEIGLPLLPVTLQQTGAASEGLLRQWPQADNGVGKHYGYAAQWFGIAVLIALLYCWFQLLQPYLHRHAAQSRRP